MKRLKSLPEKENKRAGKIDDGGVFFAASNSRNGFCDYFEDIFGKECDKIYRIYGAPGCGKSSFLKSLGTQMAKTGAEVSRFCCSSAPDSLDGIILKNPASGKRLAVIDATAPHAYPSRRPGIRDELLDFGRFWKSDRLAAFQEEIESLQRKKADAYRRAYRALHAYGVMDDHLADLMTDCVDRAKLQRAAKRLAMECGAAGEKSGGERVRLTHAFGTTGEVLLPSLFDLAEEVIEVENLYGVGEALIAEALGAAREARFPLIRFPDPICPDKTEGIYFEGTGILLYLRLPYLRGGEEAEKTISPRRFLRRDAFLAERGRVRMAQKLRDGLADMALTQLREAGRYHEMIESYYTPCMDFSALNDYRDGTVRPELMKELSKKQS